MSPQIQEAAKQAVIKNLKGFVKEALESSFLPGQTPEQSQYILKQLSEKWGKQLGVELIDAAIFPLIEEVVKESKNPIDDMLFAVGKGPIRNALVDFIGKTQVVA